MRNHTGAALLIAVTTACVTPTRPPVKAPSPELAGAIREVEQVVAREPGNGPMVFLLAIYRDRAGDEAGVLAALEQLERSGWDRGIDRTDLSAKTPAVQEAIARG